ncbi:hypothetical protein [Streptomyces rochei]|uniref:hypothetical protein n=1 Tax=Streptomyces rochei TaxID=1928 RepID=UPI0036439440
MERTDQQPPQPSPEPEPKLQLPPLFRQPATVEACQADYAAGADIRARLGWTDGS